MQKSKPDSPHDETRLMILNVLLTAFITLTFALYCLFCDFTPPEIHAPEVITATVGGGIVYGDSISATDDRSEADEIILRFDSSGVDVYSPGSYHATVRATDRAGNNSEKTITVVMKRTSCEPGELFGKIREIINERGIAELDPVGQVRAVCDYVQLSVDYAPVGCGDTNEYTYKDAAYECLFVTHRGDCYYFFAACKAFFECLGIKNKDMYRDYFVEGGGSCHYWSEVEIDGIAYHTDSCPQKGYDYDTRLMDAVAVRRFNEIRKGYYFIEDEAIKENKKAEVKKEKEGEIR